MLVVRELTEAVDDFEDLVTSTDNQDYIDDREKKLLEFVGHVFCADGTYQWQVIEEVKRVKRLGIRAGRGLVSLLIADKCDEDGEVFFKRVCVPPVS